MVNVVPLPRSKAVQRRRRLHLVYRGGAAGTETVRDVEVAAG